MNSIWSDNIDTFIRLANKYNLKFILIGGGAVNFHGYQRHSADVDFWIQTEENNLEKLLNVFNDMGYEIAEIPGAIKNQQQNISIKFSPDELSLELVTSINLDKSFEQAYKEAEIVEMNTNNLLRWHVLSYNDLINNKLKSMRPKDLLDVQELQRIRSDKKKN